MPKMAGVPCRSPGCPAVVRGGNYCPAHKRERSQGYDERRGSASRRGYGARWRKIRSIQLSEFPLCHDCIESGRVTAAKEVHHIVAKRNGGTDAPGNLMSLCKSCHSVRTNKGE